MMKRRWSNNGGFTSLRMLDDSSSEVTSSSAALVMSPGMTMSPTSLGSPEYNELELWGAYDENAYNGHSVLSNGNNNLGVGGGGGCGGGGAGVTANQLLMNGIMHGTNNLNGMMNGIGIGPGIGGGGGGGGPGGGTVGVNGQPNGIGQPNSNQIQQFVGNLISGMNHSQTIIPPLPSIIQNTIMNTPRSESVNSISSGAANAQVWLAGQWLWLTTSVTQLADQQQQQQQQIRDYPECRVCPTFASSNGGEDYV
uniref:Putative ecdysone receptor-like protein n=1 Tax=Anopheles darlingi TaxID=43151 RepID=A0A2M4CN56_ANODA